MTTLEVKTGDLLDETADAIVCPANPWLNMSGGINGEVLLRGGEAIQEELHAYLRETGRSAVEPGTVVVTEPGSLRAKHVLHAVAIDPFYDSNAQLVCRAIERVLCKARELGDATIAMPALATGYGHLTIGEFGEGLLDAMQEDWPCVNRVVVVVRREEYAEVLRQLANDRRRAT